MSDMNNLTISISDKTPIEILLQVDSDGTVSARKAYEFLELNPANFSHWCKRNILENEYAEESLDFKPLVFYDETPTGGKVERSDYKLSVPFAKKLCMKAGGEKGEQARQYFIKCEEKLKEATVSASQLSPQLQLFKQMFDSMARQELKTKELETKIQITEHKTSQVEQTLSIVKDTIIQRDDDWRKWINAMFNNAVISSGNRDFQVLRKESYEILESRARCNLGERLRRLHKRLEESGATKTKIKDTTKLDVIESDVKLKEIYTAIIKEFSIRYA